VRGQPQQRLARKVSGTSRTAHTRAIAGKLKVVEGIRPGVVAFSLGHGRWAYGSATSSSTAGSFVFVEIDRCATDAIQAPPR
jgi:hypothetical protein